MLINFGSETSRTPLGWAVDFCPFCRDLCSLLLLKVEESITIFAAPIDAKTIGHLGRCENCRTVRAVDPARYGTLFPEPQPLESLLAALPPATMSELRKRAQIEQRFRHGSLAPDERFSLIAEPLLALEPLFMPKHSPSSIGPLTVLSLVFSFMGAVVPLVLFSPPEFELGCAVGALGVVLFVISMIRDGRVAIRRATEPPLLHAYARLNPGLGELQETIHRLREEGRIAARKVSANRLYRLLGRAPKLAEPPTSTGHYQRLLS